MSDEGPKRSVYHHEVPTKTIDVYRVLHAFEVTDPCIQHAVKKLLCAGKRIGGKTLRQDIDEAIWTLNRWRQMRDEETETPPTTPREPGRATKGTP